LISTTLEASLIFKAAGKVAKISSSLKSNHHWQIELAQISETLGRRFF
jgi:hypothetical protein